MFPETKVDGNTGILMLPSDGTVLAMWVLPGHCLLEGNICVVRCYVITKIANECARCSERNSSYITDDCYIICTCCTSLHIWPQLIAFF